MSATMPGLLIDRARQTPDVTAYRHKRRGVWEVGTWAGYAADAAAIGLALEALGVGEGDRVAVAADNRPEWLIADLGVQGIGAATVGIDPAISATEVQRVLSGCQARVVVCEDEEQFDKVMEVRATLPDLVAVVVIDTPGARNLDDPIVRTWAHLLAEGREIGPAAWRAKVEALDPPTSTLPPPRGDEVLSSVPLCHPAERSTSVVDALEIGYVVNFGEGGDSFPQDIREVQPTLLLCAPGTWERMRAGTEARMADASFLKRFTYRWCMAGGRALAARRTATESRATDPVLQGLCWLLCLRQLRRKLGLGRVTTATATAPLAPPVLEWFSSLGVEVREPCGR